MIVRELFAKLGLDVDKGSFAKADKQIATTEGLLNGLRSVGLALSGGLIAAFAFNTVKAASDVNETLNVLDASFGDSAESVKEWAETSSKALGRSQYALREMAGSLGAILNPMLKDEAAAASMSTTLSGLAVDLSSFFNTTESDALAALRSGLTGETEPLKKFGVLINQTRLEEKALELGFKKGKKGLEQRAKVEAAYALILQDTTAAQGDAEKTGDGFANMLRRLEGAWLDVKIAIGGTLLGPAGGLVKWLVGAADGARELITATNALPAALIAITAALVPFIGAWIVANAPLLLAAAGLAAIVLVIEDIYTSMTGGKGKIDKWFAALLGEEEWENIKKSWIRGFDGIMDAVLGFSGRISKAIGSVWDIMSDRPTLKGEKSAERRFLDAVLGEQEAEKYLLSAGGKQGSLNGDAGVTSLPEDTIFGDTVLSGGKRRTPGSSGGSVNRVVISSPINITVKGNASRGTADEIGREVDRRLDKRNKDLSQTASGQE
jgi:hypothetical protein